MRLMSRPALSIAELKERVDLHDLADKLGWKKDASGNYSSPNRNDKNPSVSIFKATNGNQLFKDHTTGEVGSCIDMMIYDAAANDITGAVKELHNIYKFPMQEYTPQQRKTLTDIEKWAHGCTQNPQGCKPYLMNERKISEKVIDTCIQQKTLGWNTFTSTKRKPGEKLHGGPGPAFITKDFNTKQVVNFETRYVDSELNGGLKTQCQGEKTGHLYIPDLTRFKAAKTVIVVESPINALTVLTAARYPVAAVATRGVANLDLNWEVLSGKQVLVCFDNDAPFNEGKQKGHRPGPEAAWQIHNILTEYRLSCRFIDQTYEEWGSINDLNDYLIEHGEEKTRFALNRIENCLIPGLHIGDDFSHIRYKRHYLENHNANIYSNYTVTKNHTSITVKKFDEEGKPTFNSEDLCSFRIVKISKVLIQSDNATINNIPDSEPKEVYVATCDIPRRENAPLKTMIFDDDNFHELSMWKKFGAIFKPVQFARMLTLLESTISTSEKKAVNLVGLAWCNGRVIVNESKDCHFEDDNQCPYNSLSFPKGTIYQAKTVVEAYQKTFKDNAATFLLTWALGAHLKIFLKYWPHMVLEAEKGAGKSVLEGKLAQTLSMKKFSGQQVETEWRILTALSYTTHPVIWEELSARSNVKIGKALSMLQEAYNFSPSTRGAKSTKFMLAAPVCMGGEEVEAKTLLGKVVRTNINEKKGDMLPFDLPTFPVREWLEFLAEMDEKHVHDMLNSARQYCKERCAGKEKDDGAERIIDNFAAVLLAWKLLCEFIDIPTNSNGFCVDLIKEMNTFLSESEADRHPWVWIMATICSEIDADNFRYPYKFGQENGEDVIFIRCSHIMNHMATSPNLRAEFDALPIKGARVLKKQFKRAGVVVKDEVDKTIVRKRVPRMQAISLKKLAEYGLTVSIPETHPKES